MHNQIWVSYYGGYEYTNFFGNANVEFDHTVSTGEDLTELELLARKNVLESDMWKDLVQESNWKNVDESKFHLTLLNWRRMETPE